MPYFPTIQEAEALPDSYPEFHPAGAMICPGMLALLIPGHSMSGLEAVPVAGSRYPNLAALNAAKLCGGNRAAVEAGDYDWKFEQGGDIGAAKFKVERTPKGGIHFIVSQTTDSAGTWARFVPNGDPIKQYVVDHPGHTFMLYLARYTTREQDDSDGFKRVCPHAGLSHATNANVVFPIISQAEVRSGTGQLIGDNAPLDTESTFAADGIPNAMAGFGQPPPATPAEVELAIGGGHVCNQWRGYLNGQASYVLRLCALVDLTAAAAAGRSRESIIAQLDSYSEGSAAEGGIYFGDTVPTDPATIA